MVIWMRRIGERLLIFAGALLFIPCMAVYFYIQAAWESSKDGQMPLLHLARIWAERLHGTEAHDDGQ